MYKIDRRWLRWFPHASRSFYLKLFLKSRWYYFRFLNLAFILRRDKTYYYFLDSSYLILARLSFKIWTSSFNFR